MKSYELKNLDCANCALKIESALKKSPEVSDVSINFATASMKISTRDFKKSRALIREIEPGIEVIDAEADEDERPQFVKQIVYLSVMLVLYFTGVFFQDFLHSTFFEIPEYVYFITLYLITGWPVLKAAGRNILRGDFFDENFLMSLATIGAFVIHAIPEAVGVMIFYEIGRFFEDLALSRSRNSIKSLMDLRPDFAWKLDGGEALKTVPAAIKVGDMILVKPGERVPLDGVVQKGELRVDSSAITGESVPRRLKAGDEILAGMIVLDAAIEIKVTRIFSQSSVSRILELVESAVQKKAKTEKFITRFAKIYTPVVVFMALGLALIPPFVLQIGDFTQWLYRAFVILVISCPCALVISIPLGYFSG
ncbi:MAG: heavy metal translocating P-type ATPase, partial [Spirochaetales bacterium]|nr:heavy metal translocating P-type ATPase [Spirochaetales bacterium]